MNTPANDYTCYDSLDLDARATPNASIETLVAGDNTNEIVCISEPPTTPPIP